MPRWLLGGIIGLITAGLDVFSVQQMEFPLSVIVMLAVVRILIGMAIGSSLFYAIRRHLRWVRGAVISFIFSISLVILIPPLWQAMLGFGIAYGAIIGYVVDRALPLPSESDEE
jgi:hypothetical protein